MINILRYISTICNVLLLTGICLGNNEGSGYRFVESASLGGPLAAHSATRLTDGRIVVVGGYNKLFGMLPAASSQIWVYDPGRDRWTVSKAVLNHARLWHGAVRVPRTNLVLVAGGLGHERSTLKRVELWNPAMDMMAGEGVTCLDIGSMATGRTSPRLTGLADGRILITGGEKTAEIIERDPNESTGFRIRPVAMPQHARRDSHCAARLADGRVALIGGRARSIEIFDPETEAFQLMSAKLESVYDDQAAVLLYDGTVLLAGGQLVYNNRCVRHTWLYDPVNDTIRFGPELDPSSNGISQDGASDIVAVDLFETYAPLRGRYILLAGGENDPGRDSATGDTILNSAWVYDAVEKKLIAAGPMLFGHDDFAGQVLPLKRSGEQELTAGALLIAGHDYQDAFQSRCERFEMRFEIGD